MTIWIAFLKFRCWKKIFYFFPFTSGRIPYAKQMQFKLLSKAPLRKFEQYSLANLFQSVILFCNRKLTHAFYCSIFFFFFALALNGAEKAFGHLLQWEKETKKIGGLSKSGDFKLSWLNKIHEDSKIIVNVKWYNLLYHPLMCLKNIMKIMSWNQYHQVVLTQGQRYFRCVFVSSRLFLCPWSYSLVLVSGKSFLFPWS